MTKTSEDILAKPGVAQQLDFGHHPTILRILEDNPGPFTGPGTNTYLVGDEDLWIIDPGEDRDDGHREAIVEAVDGRDVLGILITHRHSDHWPLGARLAEEWRIPMIAYRDQPSEPTPKHRPFAPHRLLDHSESLSVPGGTERTSFRLTCHHTPGHCADHISFALHSTSEKETSEQDAQPLVVLCGDHVMAWSTTILAPPDGSLNHYLASLEHLMALEPSVLLPAHGPAISDPTGRMQELRDHRHGRTVQLLEALASGPATLEELVPIIYKDTDPGLHPAAAASLSAHVRALIETGEVVRQASERNGGLLALV